LIDELLIVHDRPGLNTFQDNGQEQENENIKEVQKLYNAIPV